MAPKDQAVPPIASKAIAAEPIAVGAKLRKVHPWFESLIQKAKDAEVLKRRKNERLKGGEIVTSRVREIADELESLQREMNPFEIRRKELTHELLVHWGYTGLEEIEHPLGYTLISTSFEMALDPAVIQKALNDSQFAKVTARIIQAAKLLNEGMQHAAIRDIIERAVVVRKLKVSVTPPASRRPKSGASDEDPSVSD